VVEVDATGIDDELQTVFWSGIYGSMISPQDYTGENYLWDSTEPYYDSYYFIGDSFRSIHPLLTLLDPESQTLMVRSLIDIYRHEGELIDFSQTYNESLLKLFRQTS
jgi:putative alpha-1,2-mannosidase